MQKEWTLVAKYWLWSHRALGWVLCNSSFSMRSLHICTVLSLLLLLCFCIWLWSGLFTVCMQMFNIGWVWEDTVSIMFFLLLFLHYIVSQSIIFACMEGCTLYNRLKVSCIVDFHHCCVVLCHIFLVLQVLKSLVTNITSCTCIKEVHVDS